MAKKVVTTNGKRGGNLVGKPHYDKHGNHVGGVKAVVTDAGGKPVELEGGEVIINKHAVKEHWELLSEINQSAGNGVPIHNPESVGEDYDVDVEEYEKGGGVIKFNRNHIPSGWIMSYAKKLKENHPEVWKMAGNHFGNQAFKNLERVRERGYWLDSEEWMYKKWRAFVARHKGNFRIQGVIAMLKWGDKVEKGWSYMKSLIEEEIKKKSGKSEPKAKKLEQGGQVIENKYKKKAYRTKSLKEAKAFSKKHREATFSMMLRDENTNAFKKSYILKKGEVFDALYNPIRINQRKSVYYYLESDDFDWSSMSSKDPYKSSGDSIFTSDFAYAKNDEFAVLNEAFQTDFDFKSYKDSVEWQKKYGSYKNKNSKTLIDVYDYAKNKGYLNPNVTRDRTDIFLSQLTTAIENYGNKIVQGKEGYIVDWFMEKPIVPIKIESVSPDNKEVTFKVANTDEKVVAKMNDFRSSWYSYDPTQELTGYNIGDTGMFPFTNEQGEIVVEPVTITAFGIGYVSLNLDREGSKDELLNYKKFKARFYPDNTAEPTPEPTPEPSKDKLDLFLDYSKRNDLGINVAEENQFEIEMVSTILQDDLLTKEQTLELM